MAVVYFLFANYDYIFLYMFKDKVLNGLVGYQ